MATELFAEQLCAFINNNYNNLHCTMLLDVTTPNSSFSPSLIFLLLLGFMVKAISYNDYFAWLIFLPLSSYLATFLTSTPFIPWLFFLSISAHMVWPVIDSGHAHWLFAPTLVYALWPIISSSYFIWTICLLVAIFVAWVAYINGRGYWLFVPLLAYVAWPIVSSSYVAKICLLVLVYVVWALTASSNFAWLVCFPSSVYVVGTISSLVSSAWVPTYLDIPCGVCLPWLSSLLFSAYAVFFININAPKLCAYYVTEILYERYFTKGRGHVRVGSCSINFLMSEIYFSDFIYKTADYTVTIQNGTLVKDAAPDELEDASAVSSDAFKLFAAFDGFELRVNNRCPVFDDFWDMLWLQPIERDSKKKRTGDPKLLQAWREMRERVPVMELKVMSGRVRLDDLETSAIMLVDVVDANLVCLTKPVASRRNLLEHSLTCKAGQVKCHYNFSYLPNKYLPSGTVDMDLEDLSATCRIVANVNSANLVLKDLKLKSKRSPAFSFDTCGNFNWALNLWFNTFYACKILSMVEKASKGKTPVCSSGKKVDFSRSASYNSAKNSIFGHKIDSYLDREIAKLKRIILQILERS